MKQEAAHCELLEWRGIACKEILCVNKNLFIYTKKAVRKSVLLDECAQNKTRTCTP